MAKSYYPCPKCGHDVTVVGRNRKDADRYAIYCQKRGDLCDKCKRAEWQIENERAVANSQAIGLPTLDGSEKQVAWASKIRLQMLPEIDAEKEKIETDIFASAAFLSTSARTEITDGLALIASEMRGETVAGWWIDNRDKNTAYLIEAQWSKRCESLAPTAWAECQAHEKRRQGVA